MMLSYSWDDGPWELILVSDLHIRYNADIDWIKFFFHSGVNETLLANFYSKKIIGLLTDKKKKIIKPE